MTETEKQRIFLERAASDSAERVLQLDDIIQQRIYASLEDLYFQKEDPLKTIDDEFEGACLCLNFIDIVKMRLMFQLSLFHELKVTVRDGYNRQQSFLKNKLWQP